MALTMEIIGCANPLPCEDEAGCLRCEDLREAHVYNRGGGMMAMPISNAAKVIRTLKNQVDEYHLLYAQTLAERDALQARLKLAEGLAQAASCVVATELVNRVFKDTEFLALAGLDQALAAWRAES